MSLNKVMLIGNCGRDPEVRHLDGGAVVATFPIATSERYKDKTGETREITEWHNIVCWRGLAETAEKYVRKGSQLYVEGRLRTRSYNDKDGNLRYVTEILADTFQLLGRRQDAAAQTGVQMSYPQSGLQSQTAGRQYDNTPVQSTPHVQMQADSIQQEDDDDLPF